MKLLIVLRKGTGNRQKEDHRRKDYQDKAFSARSSRNLFSTVFPPLFWLSLHDLPEGLEPVCADLRQSSLSGLQIILSAQRKLCAHLVFQRGFQAQVGLQLRRHIKFIVCLGIQIRLIEGGIFGALQSLNGLRVTGM